MNPDDPGGHEAEFQQARREALKAGPEALRKHKEQYWGVYNFSGLPWKDDTDGPEIPPGTSQNLP